MSIKPFPDHVDTAAAACGAGSHTIPSKEAGFWTYGHIAMDGFSGPPVMGGGENNPRYVNMVSLQFIPDYQVVAHRLTHEQP